MPCEYNGPPKILDQTSFQILKESCPDLVREDSRENSPVCCDAYQIKTISESLAIAAAIFARCPGCWYNYKQIFCSMICGPHQSLYVNNEVIVPSQNPDHQNQNKNKNDNEEFRGVASQELYLSENIAEIWYQSCSEVIFGPTNGYAVEVTCNPPAGEVCTPYEWLRYPGENVLAPIDLHYRLIGEVGSNHTKYSTGSMSYDQFLEETDNDDDKNSMLPYGIVDNDRQIFDWVDNRNNLSIPYP